MMQEITKGICVTVETFYNKELSNPGLNEYLYSYKISIDNLSDFPFILNSRFWEITDALGNTRTVEGEGPSFIKRIVFCNLTDFTLLDI